MAHQAAYRYAKATYELAQQAGSTEQLFEDMNTLRNTLASSSSLRNVLKNPVINLEKKADITKQVFKNTHELTHKLIALLAQKNRIHQVDQVADAFIDLYEKEHHIQRATVISATELGASTENEIRNKIKELTGSEAELTKEVDSSLIGGFLLKINDKQFDATVTGKFKKLRQELTTKN